MSDEVTTHQIEGVCEGVMSRGDWQEFHIGIGKQYPVKLASKHDDVKAAVAAVGQQKAVWTYTERDGNPNPHRPGEFFKNRYLSKVEVGAQLDPALAGQMSMSNAPGTGGSGAGSMPPEGRERSIERQTIVKAAMAVFPMAEIKTGDDWFAFITKIDEWIQTKPEAAPVAEPAPAAPVTEPAPPPVADEQDDIPF